MTYTQSNSVFSFSVSFIYVSHISQTLLSPVHGIERSDFGILASTHLSKGYIRLLNGYTRSTTSTTPLLLLWRAGCSIYQIFTRWTCLLSGGSNLKYMTRSLMCDGQGSWFFSFFFSPLFVLSSLFPFQYDVTVEIHIFSIFPAYFSRITSPPFHGGRHAYWLDVLPGTFLTQNTGFYSCLHISINLLPFPIIILRYGALTFFFSLSFILSPLRLFPNFNLYTPGYATASVEYFDPSPSQEKYMRSNATAKPSTTSTTCGPSTPSPSIPPSTPLPPRVLTELGSQGEEEAEAVPKVPRAGGGCYV